MTKIKNVMEVKGLPWSKEAEKRRGGGAEGQRSKEAEVQRSRGSVVQSRHCSAIRDAEKPM